MPEIQIRQINSRLDIAYDAYQYSVRIRRGRECRAAKFCKNKHRLILLAMELGATEVEAFEAVGGLPPTFAEFLAARSADSDGREAVVAPRTEEAIV